MSADILETLARDIDPIQAVLCNLLSEHLIKLLL